MVNKLTAVIVAITTVIMSVTGLFVWGFAPEDETEFTPVIRFVACSDSHLKTAAGVGSHRLEKTAKLAYAIAKADDEYNNLDAFLINGDITNDGNIDQFAGFKVIADKYIKSETELLPIIANNHDFRNMKKQTVAYFSQLMGKDTDYHKVVNGYHFIGISTSDVEGVFVSQHEHVLNTVYGSSDFDGWGIDDFSDILEQYPQVVDFSGHSHYPLNDPRSVWQGSFTAIGTGALAYMELTVENQRKVHPTGNSLEAQFWIVELDKDSNMRLRGIDLIEQKILCEYILANPANPANREYTPEKQAARSTAPVFNENAELKVTKLAKSVTVKFDAAQSASSEPIFLYKVKVINSDGEVVKSDWVLPKYYSATVEKTERLKLGKFEEGDYTVSVTAETAWGVQSESITTDFTVK